MTLQKGSRKEPNNQKIPGSHVVEVVGCELFDDWHTFADQSISETIAWAAVWWSARSLHSV